MRISKRATTKMILKHSLCFTCTVFLIISCIRFDNSVAHKLQQRDTTENGACAPLDIVNGDYNVLGNDYVKGTPIPNYAAVNISCNANYGLYPENSVTNICINGQWSNQPLQECRQLCPPRTSTSVNLKCTLDNKDVDCTKPVVDGTVAESSCNQFYYLYDGFPTSKCSGGSWNNPLIICEPECGQLISTGGIYVVRGHDAVRGEFPWHIGLYQFNAAKSTYDYLCGGSIITPLIVVTAAHCVANYKAEEFYVAAGKYHSNYDAPEDNLVQKRQVKEYHTPREYRGHYSHFEADLAVLVIKQAFTLSNVVQPVCVDWTSAFEEYQLKPKKLGNVVGWGYTDPGKFKESETLKQLTAEYIDRQDCLDTVPKTFLKWMTLDKFCAGWTNGSSVCKGDSGGGLVFEWMDNDRHKIKYYLRGLVSVGPLKESQCDNYKYGVYTKISAYIGFIRQVVSNNQVQFPARRSTAVNVKDGACAPLNIVNGDYDVLGIGHVKGYHIPNYVPVDISCNANYSLYPSESINICFNGEWRIKPLQECRHIPCPDTAFRCRSGACLDSDVKCNGVVECADGSDEEPTMCSGGTLKPTPTTGPPRPPLEDIPPAVPVVEPKNPCQPSPCGPNSQCREVNGLAVCSCLPTYFGSPPGCSLDCTVSSECPEDKTCINKKCVDPCPGVCGINATCNVIKHSPICSCISAYTGDPFTRCYPIPPQEEEVPIQPTNPCVPSPCGPNSQCRDIGGSPTCSCLATYIGQPPNCRPECRINSECPSKKACIREKCTDPCPGVCGLNAYCNVISHNPVCTCPEGLTGDPFHSCIPKPKP